MSKDPYTKTVRLSDTQRQKILDELDQSQEVASDKMPPENNRRVDPRYPYRLNDIPLVVKQPGGAITRLLVSSRNLSSGGIAFLHGGFLYIGSRCTIQLSGPSIEPVFVGGEIVNCRHIDGVLHEVCVKFESPIELEMFIHKGAGQTASKSDQNPPQQKRA